MDNILQFQAPLDQNDLLKLKQYLISVKPMALVDQNGVLDSILPTIFDLVLSSLKNSSGISHYRIICCDVLSIWLLRAGQVAHNNPIALGSIETLIDNETCTFLIHYIIDFLEQSGAPLGNSLRDLLSKILVFIKKVKPQAKEALVRDWIDYSLTLSYTTRTLYYMIEILCKEIDDPWYVLTKSPEFPKNCIAIMWSNALANSSGKALNTIFKYIYKTLVKANTVKIDIKWLALWENDVKNGLNDLSLRKNVQTYLLPLFFKISSISYKEFVRGLTNIHKDSSDDEVDLLIGCLRVGQTLAIVEEPFHGDDALISLDHLKQLLIHKSNNFRVAAYALLTSSPRGSKPIQPYVYEILIHNIDMFYVESDLEVRNDYYSLTRQFISRVRDSSYSFDRDYKKLLKKDMKQEADAKLLELQRAKQYLSWKFDYLLQQLRPGTSYQRLNLGYKMLLVLIKSGLDQRVDSKHFEKSHIDYPFHIALFTKTLMRLLIDNITNDFEDIRELSVQILLMCPSEVLKSVLTESVLDSLYDRAIDMLSDIKGRRGDGGARILQFLFIYSNDNLTTSFQLLDKVLTNLNNALDQAELDLRSAVYQQSVHGHFTSLNLIFQTFDFKSIKDEGLISQWKEKIDNIVTNNIFRVWNTVKHILVHDSLEGNLPEDMEDGFDSALEQKYGPATQIILSYAWRSVKESTNLLCTILDTCPAAIIDDELILKSGEIILQQLSSVRHRGAFSSVYPTFISCCKRCNETETLKEYPQLWLKNNISLIYTKSQYISRRSGGLPFLITAVLTADKSRDQKLIDFTFENLMSIANEEYIASADQKMDIPQVHAFNCIKHIFIDAQLSDVSSGYVNQALVLCLSNFNSDTWAIRNCAVMLFTALQNRIFGTKKLGDILPSVSARLFFSKYEGVRDTLIVSLRSYIDGEKTDKNIEILFPVLTILSRLQPSQAEDTELNDFLPLLELCLENTHWKVREMAARTISAVLHPSKLFEHFEIIIKSSSAKNQNRLHGNLLTCREILVKSREGVQKVSIPTTVHKAVLTEISNYLMYNRNYATAKVFVSIIGELYKNSEKELTPIVTNIMGNYFIAHVSCDYPILDGSRQALLSEIVDVLLPYYLSTEDYAVFTEFVQLCFLSNLYEVQVTCLKFCLLRIGDIDIQSSEPLITSLWDVIEDIHTWSYVNSLSLTLLQQLSTKSGVTYSEEDLTSKFIILNSFLTDENSEDVRATTIEAMTPLAANLVILKQNASIDDYINIVDSFSNESQPFPVRLSALNSLISFVHILKSHQNGSLHHTRAIFGIYKFLDDDDEDLRELASDSLSNFMGLTYPSVSRAVSIVFNESFVQSHKEQAWKVVFDGILSRDIKRAFRDSSHGDNALFSVEKYNLYRNDIESVRELNQMAFRCREYIKQDERNILINKVSSDLDFVIERITTIGFDGYLGWTRDEGVYCALVEVLVNVKLLVELGYEGPFSDALIGFNSISEKVSLHELIRECELKDGEIE